MDQKWPRNDSPTGRGFTQGSDSYRPDDMARMDREEAWYGQKMADRDAFALILRSAKEASKVQWASGNLALIEQICEAQLRADPA